MPGYKGNANALKHGGGAAEAALVRGEPFHGIAVMAERNVIAEYEESGPLAMIEQNAIRLQTACDLYWNAIQKATQDGDLKALHSYVARFGWLAGASLRAWAQVASESRRHDPLDAATVLEAVKRGNQQSK